LKLNSEKGNSKEVIKMKHGIAIREKETNKLVGFMECEPGQSPLIILSGCRINLDKEFYKANEEFVKEEEIEKIEE